MIPILFEKTDTDFTTHGLCRLPDALSAEAYTEGNGQREFTLEYPVTGENYDEILIERIIGAYADDSKSIQGYRIYAITKPINGIVTIYAHHVSYDLSGKIVTVPSGSYTPSSLMTLLFSGTSFTGWSDIADSKTVEFSVPTSVASILGGVEGSILDTFGGEYEFDNFTVKLHAQKGADNGVIVEYGKNITNIVDEYNTEGVLTSIVPYATYTDSSGLEQTVVGDKITFNSVLTVEKTAAIDFSDKFDYDNAPTKAALATLGNAYIANNNPGNTVSNITLSFVPLWYDGSDDSVGLYDTITARHTKLGVDKQVKVVAIWYDCLAERISRMTCGRLSSNFVSTVVDLQSQEAKTAKEITVFPDRWKQAVEAATNAITGNDGGYVILHKGNDGHPYELLVLDNPDITQAQNVWRWTLGGLGFSSNGYAGPYETAITADGQINANFITTGIIDASLINAGILRVKDINNNVLFEANITTKTVNIAGFTVKNNSFEYTLSTPSGSGALASYENTSTVHVGTDNLNVFRRKYELSDGGTPFASASSVTLGFNDNDFVTQLLVQDDHSSDPDGRYYARGTYDSDQVTIENWTKRSGGTRNGVMNLNLNELAFEEEKGSYRYGKYFRDEWRVGSGTGNNEIYGNTNGVYATNQIYTTRLMHNGVQFDGPEASSLPTLTVMQSVHTEASAETIDLLNGVYLAIVSHNNNSASGEQGLYLIQCRTSGNSVVRAIASANSTTLSISGGTLTWATTNTYRTLTLIRVSA